MVDLVIYAIFSFFAFLFAYFLGKKRQIGFGWSFFFCFLLTPIFGLIITLLSRKYHDPNPKPSTFKKVVGWIIIVISCISLLGQILEFSKGGGYVSALLVTIGLIGLGIYLLELGKGKNFKTQSLTKMD